MVNYNIDAASSGFDQFKRRSTNREVDPASRSRINKSPLDDKTSSGFGGMGPDPEAKAMGLGSPTNRANKRDDDDDKDVGGIGRLFAKFFGAAEENGLEFTTPDKKPKPSIYDRDDMKSLSYDPRTRTSSITGYPSDSDMRSSDEIMGSIDEMLSGENDPEYSYFSGSTYDEVRGPERNIVDAVNMAIDKTSATGDYKVRKGDTLSEIAEAAGTTVRQLQLLNNIPDPRKMQAGSKLRVPATTSQDKEIIESATKMSDLKPLRFANQSMMTGDQRRYFPEDTAGLNNPQTQEDMVDLSGFGGMGPDPSTGQPVQGLMSPSLTAAQRTAMSDMGSDVARTNLYTITNARGNYSETALTDAVDKGIRNQTKKALLKGSIETEIGERGLITEGTGYRLNRAYEMFEDATVDAALESLPPSEQTRIRNGAASNALGEAIMDMAYDGGSEYRGRGLVQLTHRENYQAVEDILESNGINIDLVNNPDLANDTRYALPIAMAYLEHAGLDDTASQNSSAKDLNNRINAGAGSTIANERWENVVQALRDTGQDEEANRMENRNEYAAQETVDTAVDGDIGPNSRAAMREWLSERNITIPQNATDMDLVVLVNENS